MTQVVVLDDNFKSKNVTIKEVSDLLRSFPSFSISDASCILMVNREFEKVLSGSKKSINVYIAGPTCSGKTTLAERIKIFFQGRAKVSVIHQDDYFKNLYKIPHGNGGYLMDSKEAFHKKKKKNDFSTLLSSGMVRVPYYDIKYNKRTGHRPATKKGQINIVEGLHAIDIFKDDAEGIFFYMNVPLETCLKRRIARDTRMLGVSEKRVREYFEECIMPMYERDILPQYYLNGLEKYYKYKS